MDKDKNELIENMLEAFTVAAYDTGRMADLYAWWPINYLPYGSLIADDLNKSFLRSFFEIQKKFSNKEIAEKLKYSTASWLLLAPSFLRTLNDFIPDKEKRLKFIFDFLEIISFQKAGDIFCRDGKNIVLTKREAEKIVQNIKLIDIGNESFDQSFLRLNANLLSYDEAVFWSSNCATREVHGPYTVSYQGKKAQLIVREYYRLKAHDLEPETRNLPFESITTYSLYDTDLGFNFSILNDYSSTEALPKHLLANAGFIIQNGKKKFLDDEKSVSSTYEVMETVVSKIAENVQKLSKEKLIIQAFRRAYYKIFALNETISEGWLPSSDFFARIEKELTTFTPPPAKKIEREDFKAVIDPR